MDVEPACCALASEMRISPDVGRAVWAVQAEGLPFTTGRAPLAGVGLVRRCLEMNCQRLERMQPLAVGYGRRICQGQAGRRSKSRSTEWVSKPNGTAAPGHSSIGRWAWTARRKSV